MSRIRQYIKLISEMGFSWVFFRTVYWAYQKTSIQRLFFPIKKNGWGTVKFSCDFISKDEIVHHFHRLTDLHANSTQIRQFYQDHELVGKIIIERYEKIKSGKFTFFSGLEYDIGFPPDWFKNPLTQKHVTNKLHWTTISDFSSGAGDIKFVWELSRFEFVYDLVRYYILSNNEEAVGIFWQLVNDWIEKNPPEIGPHWKCGQEIAIRSIAWLFGLIYFLPSEETTVENVNKIIKVLSFNARHIEKNFWYANRCVKNNHTISEASGLFTIGTLLPFLKRAKRWENKGWKHLETEALWQIYPDGAYIQHSHNYHRLVIQLYTWCGFVGSRQDRAFSEKVIGRITNSLEFLYQHQDELTGFLPNYGSNDGTLLQPLSGCEYSDYRPQLQSASIIFLRKRLYPPGIWEENILWLTKSDKLDILEKFGWIRSSTKFPKGGYYILRDTQTTGHATIRCATYHHRPVQADMLHFDFWIDGVNVLCDSGSYSYNSKFINNRYFTSTRAHNTIEVDGDDQMVRLSAFLWIGWPQSIVTQFIDNGKVIFFQGEMRNYQNVVHRRSIHTQSGNWTITDDVEGNFRNATIHWNIKTGTLLLNGRNLRIFIPGKIIRITTNYEIQIDKGYVSDFYGNMETIQKIHGEKEAKDKSCRFTTIIRIDSIQKEFESQNIGKEIVS